MYIEHDFACLIWFFTSQSTIFQLCQDRSSWVEPELSKDKCVLLKDTTHDTCEAQSTAPRSWVKHSTTEPLCSQVEHEKSFLTLVTGVSALIFKVNMVFIE